MKSRICGQCLNEYQPNNPNSSVCSWDCAKIQLLEKHPGWALRNETLARLAFDEGIVIEKTDEGLTISNRFMPDDDEQWRLDLHDIKRKAREAGRPVSFEVAWNKTAERAIQRALNEYPDTRQQVIERKAQGTKGNGKIRTIRHK